MEISPEIIQGCGDSEMLCNYEELCLFICVFFCHFGLLSDRTSSDIRDKVVQLFHDPPGKPAFQDGT